MALPSLSNGAVPATRRLSLKSANSSTQNRDFVAKPNLKPFSKSSNIHMANQAPIQLTGFESQDSNTSSSAQEQTKQLQQPGNHYNTLQESQSTQMLHSNDANAYYPVQAAQQPHPSTHLLNSQSLPALHSSTQPQQPQQSQGYYQSQQQQQQAYGHYRGVSQQQPPPQQQQHFRYHTYHNHNRQQQQQQQPHPHKHPKRARPNLQQQQQQQQQQQSPQSHQAMDRKITFKFKSGEQFVSYAYLTPQKIIGEGSYASVASAVDTRTKKKYAIKKNRNAFANIGDAKRILRELKLMFHFRGNSHLMGVLDVISPEYGTQQSFNDVYLIMPKMHMTLAKLILKSSIGKLRMHESDVQHIMYQICRGMQYMHCGGVIHRDLKPENILVNCYSHHCDDASCNIQNYSLWQVKITDFGLARGIGSTAPHAAMAAPASFVQTTASSTSKEDLTEYVVTRYYRAPEVMCCSRSYDTQIDVWSLGCIMGEMYFKRPVFRGNNHLHQLQVIFYYCGTPDDLSWVTMKDAEQWILQLPKHDKKNYKHEFSFYNYCNSGSDPKFAVSEQRAQQEFEPWNVSHDDKCGTMSDAALDFLEKLLVVDPNKRWNINAILNHSWLNNVCQAKDETECAPFDTSFEHEPILRTNFGVRHMMYEELMMIHKHCRHNLSPPSN